jgi:hypothetical protein
VSGWRNKILAATGSRAPKPLAARIAAKVIARYRPLSHSIGSGQAKKP